jgi:hypothetical protein
MLVLALFLYASVNILMFSNIEKIKEELKILGGYNLKLLLIVFIMVGINLFSLFFGFNFINMVSAIAPLVAVSFVIIIEKIVSEIIVHCSKNKSKKSI